MVISGGSCVIWECNAMFFDFITRMKIKMKSLILGKWNYSFCKQNSTPVNSEFKINKFSKTFIQKMVNNVFFDSSMKWFWLTDATFLCTSVQEKKSRKIIQMAIPRCKKGLFYCLEARRKKSNQLSPSERFWQKNY